MKDVLMICKSRSSHVSTSGCDTARARSSAEGRQRPPLSQLKYRIVTRAHTTRQARYCPRPSLRPPRAVRAVGRAESKTRPVATTD
ncbi:hypothetical protein EVAR_76734_1 [Eumeta japonica]|uniref:Uncharacterized protein n=1 Tax=Eumeta variegata TaxID=151549 RepID=A0A4C1STK4_EUMVA|nr:hypothetical protein EVAR_76734_1 [Eumeta japonica]